jgi:hypothetical protein
LKAARELEQAKATAAVTREYLPKDFYGADLTALLKTLQDLRTSLG